MQPLMSKKFAKQSHPKKKKKKKELPTFLGTAFTRNLFSYIKKK